MSPFVFCVLFIFAVSATPAENSVQIPRLDKHNLIKCESKGQETWEILDSETVTAKGHFLQVVEQTITFPTEGLGDKIISCIRVTDLIGDGTGGFPDIETGGLGFHYVTIHFTSQRSHGFKFLVEIHGKPQP